MGDDGGGNGSGGGQAGGHGGASGGGAVAHAGNGEVGAPHAPAGGHGGEKHHGSHNDDGNTGSYSQEIARPVSPPSRGTETPNPFSRKNTSLDLDDYFVSSFLINLHEENRATC